jgi:chorismate dehydratase
MKYRIAAVSFLNSVPLIEGLAERDDRVALTSALPSRLVELLHADEVDVALLPVVEHFRRPGGRLLPGIGIAADGAVGSVKLFTRSAPAQITRVAVDRGSRTSVALLRILLAERFGIRPDFFAVKPTAASLLDSEEAVLVIGDRCFEFTRQLAAAGTAEVAAYDLGALWRDLTGLPFVFAAWVVGPRFAARASGADQAALAALLTAARDRGLADLAAIAAREAARGRLGSGGRATAAAVRDYLGGSLRYVLGEREQAGLRRFHELCVAHAVLPARPALRAAAADPGA